MEGNHDILLKKCGLALHRVSVLYPEIPELVDAWTEIQNSSLKPNENLTWEELDKEAQDLKLNNINGNQGRIFYRDSLKTLRKTFSL